VLQHLVVLKLDDQVNTAGIRAIVDALNGLVPQLAGLRSYSIGTDVGLVEGNGTIGISAVFDDVDAWRAYQSNAEHQRIIADMIRPVLASRLAVQVDV